MAGASPSMNTQRSLESISVPLGAFFHCGSERGRSREDRREKRRGEKRRGERKGGREEERREGEKAGEERGKRGGEKGRREGGRGKRRGVGAKDVGNPDLHEAYTSLRRALQLRGWLLTDLENEQPIAQ